MPKPNMMPEPTLRLASYNIQKYIGLDLRRQPRRTLQVIDHIGAQIVLRRRFCHFSCALATIRAKLAEQAMQHKIKEAPGSFRTPLIQVPFIAGTSLNQMHKPGAGSVAKH